MDLKLNTLEIMNAPADDYLDLLSPFFEYYQCVPGTLVVQQGRPADYLYLVISGTVDVSYKPYDGNSITIAHVEKGGWFGWSSAVGSQYYTSSAFATKPLEAVRVRGSDIRRFCLENPEAGNVVLGHLVKSVSGRWQNANDQVLSILTQGMRES